MMRMRASLNPITRVGGPSRTAGAAKDTGAESQRMFTAVRLARWRLATDTAMLLVAGALELVLAPAAQVTQDPGWRIAFILIVLGLLGLRGSYRATLGNRFLDDARVIVSATALAAMFVTFVRVTFTNEPQVAEEAIRSWLFAAVYLVVGRAVLAIVTERANVVRSAGAPTLILGAGQVGHLIARRLLAHPELGLRPVGFLDPDPLKVERPSGLPVLGAPDDLENVAREQGIEHAIVGFSSTTHDVQLGIARALHRMKISVSIVPRLFEGFPDTISLERVGGLPLVTIYPSNPKDWRVSIKYASDRVLALLAILVVSPLLLIGAVGTALTVGRPIFFRQRRVGLDDNEFDILKFRTMRSAKPEEAERSEREVGHVIDQGLGPGGSEGAERQSRFGSFLRRTNIDELPQLFNVVRGQMSIVGPRPERASYVAMFKDRVRRYGDRHQVKAGITGWAQVHGLRGNTSLDDRIEWDNYYIENWSPWLDFKIVLLTFVAVFRDFAK
jgi:exopolysaccharide biosynthesis polyprenyl glycosylphosphotransferase